MPESVDAPGHLDEAPAELVWGPLAATGGVEPLYSAGRCNVYCHGATLAGGTATQPIWTLVDRSQVHCDSCH
ncbi:MAG: CxxxxCH/CxxCH domain-containing protein, partial [Myxococcota bacterium]